eukprot:735737-Alexandrium_andersonii.AAC.1
MADSWCTSRRSRTPALGGVAGLPAREEWSGGLWKALVCSTGLQRAQEASGRFWRASNGLRRAPH